MNVQVMYKREIKPGYLSAIIGVPILFLIAAIAVFCIASSVAVWTSDEMTDELLPEVLTYLILCIALLLCVIIGGMECYKLSIKKILDYKNGIKEREFMLKNGTRYKGKIVDILVTSQTHYSSLHRQPASVTYSYAAVIEYQKNGITRIFTTPELNLSPKEISTKNVSVYVYNDKEYATDFGTVDQYVDRSRSLI